MANLYSQATKGLQNLGRNIAADYVGATKGLQNFGRRIAANEADGQKALREGKMKTYGAINPFKPRKAATMPANAPKRAVQRFSRVTGKKI